MKNAAGFFPAFHLGFLLQVVVLSSLCSQQLSAVLEVRPATVDPGEWAKVQVMVTDDKGEPVNSAIVILTAEGGVFADSGDNRSRGTTGSDGRFETGWSCEACAASYQLMAEVRKVEQRLELRQTIALGASGGAPVSVTAGIRPSETVSGHPVRVEVEVLRGDAPVKGASVKIGAGGGSFSAYQSGMPPNLAVGKTDAGGNFQSSWLCQPCAGSYDFTVLVEVEGEDPLTVRMPLKIVKELQDVEAEEEPSAISGSLRGCSDCGFFQITAGRLADDGFERSVRVSNDCTFHLSLLPGLYQVEMDWVGEGTKAGIPQEFQINVNAGRETKVNFRCP